MTAQNLLLLTVVITAVGFDFTNGFHDTANAMATSIATGALRPKVAVALSGALNFVGAFLSLKVSATIANNIVDQGSVTLAIVFAGLAGAIIWNLATWYLGLPSSSSHALIGGVIGATWVAAGSHAVLGKGILKSVVIPALLAPFAAGLVALLGTLAVYLITRRIDDRTRTHGFRIAQVGSASLVSLAHGTNDAQKTMGIITLALVANHTIDKGAATPTWVIVLCALAISLGTYLGGWRVIRTLGKGITEIETPQGFAAEGASASVILASSHFGYPLSTTHVVSGSVLGSGVGRRLAEVRWSVAGRMAVAWVLTLPAAAVVGGVAVKAADGIGGTTGVVVMALVLAACAAGFFVASRRAPVSAHNVNDDWSGSTAPTDHERVPAGV
ncbi:PiT family inorganic phosphate transporter [Motilibacter rhizosphaerae]|uniref:Phosphate transporter n=1 Tax=Motilibacter rhizosphaerae TaxID=598652 RepID=A0A4Q7NS50_9ACTN|nr:inorganic phosphate transporter [Motilibacter rhizosphaerae]RZS89943.1 PiT family inorganic phosphate transporter [Motilibacter rhizosphaerae]